jgi:lambda repressor-like predicted transcriptional regulator
MTPPNGRPWTKERLDEAVGLLTKGCSLNQTAYAVGVTRAALTNALRRAGKLPQKKWVFDATSR